MADDKKNIPDAGKVDEPPKPGKVEPVKADPPVQDQPAPAKAEAPVVEDASKVVTRPLRRSSRLRRVRRLPKTRTLLLRLRRVRRRARTRSRPRSPAWEIPPPLERWWILPLPGMGRRRASPRKRLRPRIRASRRIKRRMRPSPAGAAHPRLTRRPPTRPSRNLGTKCPKANRLPGKALPQRRRPRLQPSSRPPLGMPPVA